MPNPVEIRGPSYSSTVTLTRPNDTTAYAANDVIGTATSAARSSVKIGFGKANGGFSTGNYAMGFTGASLTTT